MSIFFWIATHLISKVGLILVTRLLLCALSAPVIARAAWPEEFVRFIYTFIITLVIIIFIVTMLKIRHVFEGILNHSWHVHHGVPKWHLRLLLLSSLRSILIFSLKRFDCSIKFVDFSYQHILFGVAFSRFITTSIWRCHCCNQCQFNTFTNPLSDDVGDIISWTCSNPEMVVLCLQLHPFILPLIGWCPI